MKRTIFLILFLFFSFSQYIIVKRPEANILDVYLPKAYVENPYTIRIFILNNGTENLEVSSINVSDGKHEWKSSSENPEVIPPGYVGVLEYSTYLFCEDFNNSYYIQISFTSDNETITKTYGPYTPSSPIYVDHPPVISTKVNEEKRIIVDIINRGAKSHNISISLNYPEESIFSYYLIDNNEISSGRKALYLIVIPFKTGRLGYVTLRFSSFCPYIVENNVSNIFVKSYSEIEEKRITIDEMTDISFLIFIILVGAAGIRQILG